MNTSFWLCNCLLISFALVAAEGQATDYSTHRFDSDAKRSGIQMQQGAPIQDSDLQAAPDVNTSIQSPAGAKNQSAESKAQAAGPAKATSATPKKLSGPLLNASPHSLKTEAFGVKAGGAGVPTGLPMESQSAGSMFKPAPLINNRKVLRIIKIPAPQPRKGAVHKYFQAYDTALKQLIEPSGAYTLKRTQCTNRGFTPEEQASAGCLQNDIYAECSKKLMVWCAAAERKPYHDALAAVAAAARRLSEEADADAKTRTDYLGMPY